MELVRDAKGDYPLGKILLREPTAYLSALVILHDNDDICPVQLRDGDWIEIVETCGLRLEPATEYLLRSLAAVLILIADEKDFHWRADGFSGYKY